MSLICIVSGDPRTSASLKTFLERRSHEVEVCSDPTQVLSTIEHRPPSIVIIDGNLDGMRAGVLAQTVHNTSGGMVKIVGIIGKLPSRELQLWREADAALLPRDDLDYLDLQKHIKRLIVPETVAEPKPQA